jgi:hypothetical protein
MTKKALVLEDFTNLLAAQQFDLLQNEGVYIGKRKLADKTLVLFQLHSFYVEVWYSQFRKKADQLVVSTDTGILQAYLDQVDVTDLEEEKDEN